MRALRCLMLTGWLCFFAFTQLASIMLIVKPLIDSHWFFSAGRGAELIDFSQFYQAGQLVMSGQARHVYDPQVQQWWANGLTFPYISDKIFYNQSVPFLYLICLPFGLLAYNHAYVTWCLVWEAVSLLCLWLLLKRYSPLSKGSRLLFISGVMASIPAYLCIWHGQTTFLLLACFALFTYFLLAGKSLSGIFIALSTFKPQYGLLFGSALLGVKAYRVILVGALAELVLFALAGLFIGFDNIAGYPQVLIRAEGSEHFIGVNPHYMVSVRGLLSVLLPHKTAMAATVALLALALLPWLYLGRKLALTLANLGSETGRFYIALTFVLALLLSPHSHYFDCLLLAVAAAITLPSISVVELWRLPARSVWYRIWCAILVVYPLVSWPINFCFSREFEGICFLALNSALFVSGLLALLSPRAAVQ